MRTAAPIVLVLGFVFFGCTRTIVREVESRECQSLRSAAENRPQAGESSEAIAERDVCSRLCGKFADCNPAAAQNQHACTLQCSQQRQYIANNNTCFVRREKLAECKTRLTCEDLATHDQSAMSWMAGVPTTDFPCKELFEEDFLYCSGSPLAGLCYANCTKARACSEKDKGATVDECAIGCLHSFQERLQQHGVACRDSFVEYLQCRSALSCGERNLKLSPESEKCGAQLKKQLKYCKAPEKL